MGFIDVGDISITELPIPTTVVDDASTPESWVCITCPNDINVVLIPVIALAFADMFPVVDEFAVNTSVSVALVVIPLIIWSPKESMVHTFTPFAQEPGFFEL